MSRIIKSLRQALRYAKGDKSAGRSTIIRLQRRCPKCRTGVYTQGKAADGRPEFTCTQCDYVWTAGHSGHPYVEKETP